MCAKRQEKKRVTECRRALTPHEWDLVMYFRVMTDADRELLLFMAKKMIKATSGSECGRP